MKTKVTTIAGVFVFAFVALLSSCTQDNVDSVVKSYTDDEFSTLSQSLDLPQGTYEYKNPELPQHLQNAGFSGANISNHGATLGRVLFYDNRLSANNTVSCASCHEQKNAFADPRAASLGFEGEGTRRNSLALGNARFYYHDRGFFWDDRARTVEEQVEQTMQNHVEMGMDLNTLPDRLTDDYYKILFRRAFGDESVTFDRVASALSQFVRSLISSNSEFDVAYANSSSTWNINNDFSQFTAEENLGKELYVNNCESCHGNILFLNRPTGNNGLDMVYEDNGLGELNGQVSSNGHFKVPHLRNIELTGPYMHDGRFETLEEVVEHYSSGIQNHPQLSQQLKAGNQPKHLNLSENEKTALVSFLKTLTDYEYTTDAKLSDPFK